MSTVRGLGARTALVGAALVMSAAGCADARLESQDTRSGTGKFLLTVQRRETVAILTANSDGSRLHRLEIGDIAQAADAVWSWDGKRIAFSGCAASECGDASIYVMDADGTHLRRLTTGPDDWDPAWSPDGTRIVFSRLLDDGHSRLFVVDVETEEVLQLTDDATYQDRDADWSPDGTRIAFMRNADSFPSIYVIDADGANLRRVLQLRPAALSDPAWSPDGTRIAFVRDEHQTSDYDLFVMDVDGSDVHQLAEGEGAMHPPAPVWSPDGDRIAFLRGADLYALDVASAQEATVIELQRAPFHVSVDWSS